MVEQGFTSVFFASRTRTGKGRFFGTGKGNGTRVSYPLLIQKLLAVAKLKKRICDGAPK